MRAVFVDGQRVADATIALDVDDPGLTLGWTVFETMRTYGRRVYRLNSHLRRLANSCESAYVSMPTEAQLRATTAAVIAAIPDCDLGIRVTVLKGGRWIVRGAELGPALPSLRCATAPFSPQPSLPGWVKHGSRLAGNLSLQDARADEVLWVDEDGALLEGTRSNIFAVRHGELLTPPLDGRILGGITREGLIDAARATGVAVCEQPLRLRDGFDELYATSTLKQLCPIVSLDGIAAAGAGPVGVVVEAAFVAEAMDT